MSTKLVTDSSNHDETPASSLPLTLGILGGGQLGRMTALAAIRMGLRVRILTPDASGPEEAFSDVIVGDWTDTAVLKDFVSGCDAITVESEWAPVDELVEFLPDAVGLFPYPETLQIIRHKGRQKKALLKAGLPLAPFARCKTLAEAQATAREFDYPVVLKRYEGSYDGYGNATCDDDVALANAWDHIAAEDGALLEAWVPFVEELSVLIARRPDGHAVVYPVAYTEQADHRCHAVVVPADLPESIAVEAQRISLAAVEAVGGIGITAVELFRLVDGRVLINELAPRPHNTGHYTIEACHTSQFENHVRAVMGWPLGLPDLRVPAACMVNVFGLHDGPSHPDPIRPALEIADASVHMYGKTDVRNRRKMGHVTVTADNPETARARAETAAALISV